MFSIDDLTKTLRMIGVAERNHGDEQAELLQGCIAYLLEAIRTNRLGDLLGLLGRFTVGSVGSNITFPHVIDGEYLASVDGSVRLLGTNETNEHCFLVFLAKSAVSDKAALHSALLAHCEFAHFDRVEILDWDSSSKLRILIWTRHSPSVERSMTEVLIRIGQVVAEAVAPPTATRSET